MLPLLYFGPEAYIAGVAAGAAAEEMYGQLAQGKTTGEALKTGTLTAGVEVLAGKITKVDTSAAKVPIKTMIATVKEEGAEGLKRLAKKVGVTVSEEGALYLMDFLADKIKQNPDAVFNPEDFLKEMVRSKMEDVLKRQAEKFYEELERAWKTIG